MLKKILLAAGGLVAILVASLIVLTVIAPTKFTVEKEIVVNRPKSEVFDYLKLVKNQNNWSVWSKKDPNMKQSYQGTDGTVGFVSAWESENGEVGSGQQKITKIVEGERIDTELLFKEPFESASQGYFITEDAGENRTKVRWGFFGAFPRPLNIMLLFFDFDEAAGKEFEESLASLKMELEKPANK